MPFFSIASLMTRAFYALKDTATPVKVATVSFVVNVGLSWFLKDRLGASGLVLASTVAVLVQTVALQHLLSRRLPVMHLAALWGTLGKVVIATAVMGGLVFAGWYFLRDSSLTRRTADALAIFALIPLSALGYGLVLFGLRVDGRDELAGMIRRVSSKFGIAR
jgi:putative peptidoglycan lipid II flippase